MLEEIEAELQRCQAVLAGSGASSEGLRKLSFTGGRQQSSRGTSAKCGPASPLPQPSPQPQPPQAAGRPKPKSMADLLAILEDAPAGPVEIDTALLYSPQSSAGDLPGSPSGSSVAGSYCGGRSPAGRQAATWAPAPSRHEPKAQQQQQQPQHQQLAGEFSLRAYRPAEAAELGSLFDDAAAGFGSSLQLADGLYSPGSQASLDLGALQQQQQQLPHYQQVGMDSLGGPGLLSPADSEVLHSRQAQRPLSAPQQLRGSAEAAAAPPVSQRSSSQLARAPVASRQLQLDDVLACGVRGATAGLLAAGREARLQRLAQPRTSLWEACARRRIEEERQELQECTFAPKVGRPPESHRHRTNVPVDERLYRHGEGKWEVLERAKAAQESAQLADCTFAPQLNKPERHLRGEYKPIHQRVGEEQKRRSAKLAQLRVLEDLINPHTTFSPRLNPRSLQLAAEKEERELCSPGRASSSMRQSRSFAAEATEGDTCTFSPAINPASQRLLEDSASVPSDFQERLRYYSQRRDQRQRQLQAEQGTQACTFRPDTGNAVEVLAFSERAGNLLETEAERCERMARQEAERLEARRAAKEKEIYGGLDFKPQLNPRSLRMAKPSTVEELASAEKASRKVAQLRAEEEERLRRECTFQPNTAKPRVKGYGDEYEAPQPRAKLAIAGQGFDTILERIQDYQAEREAKAAKAKDDAERRQLQECSFAPEINRQAVQAKGPVVVKGLDRYLELKQLAERQKREAEERAAQVFKLNPKGPVSGRTVPQPFKLAGTARLEQRAQEKQGEALQSALQQRMQECTFRPQTNHAKRQQALARLLGNGEETDVTAA